jgi:hypothetical protein
MYRDDGRVAVETYVGWIEQKYENKKCIRWLKKLKTKVYYQLIARIFDYNTATCFGYYP